MNNLIIHVYFPFPNNAAAKLNNCSVYVCQRLSKSAHLMDTGVWDVVLLRLWKQTTN